MAKPIPYPEGLPLVRSLLSRFPQLGELAAIVGSDGIKVLLQRAPAKPKPLSKPAHLVACSAFAVSPRAEATMDAANLEQPQQPIFGILINEQAWSMLTPKGREAALLTQLLRMQAEEVENDDELEIKRRIAPVPIQTWDLVLDTYGRWDQTEVLEGADADEAGAEDEVPAA